MVQNFENIINLIKVGMTRDINNASEINTLGLILNAYNRYQEDERDGANYMFKLFDQKDLQYLVCKLNVGTTDISWAIDLLRGNKDLVPLFYYGVGADGLVQVGTWDALRTNLINYLDEIISCVILYPWVDEYKEIYTKYITEYLEKQGFTQGF